jgi:protein TonB
MPETAIRLRDDPWSRLPWLVPAALILTLLSQIGFLSLLRQPANQAAPRPVDVQIVELPVTVPAAPQPTPPAPPARRPPPPPKARVEPPAPRPTPPQPEARVEVPRDPTPPVATDPAAPAAAAATVPVPAAPSVPSATTGPPAETPVAALPPSRGPKGPPGGTENMSARAIYKPLPEIPESLRRRTMELVAVARFRVTAGGGAEVELTEPTSDPDLNRALIETLKRWRFFPAMQSGKPVASTIEIRIPISVK